MRYFVFVAAILAAGAAGAELADSGYRETWSGEPFTGAPLGLALAKGGLGIAWGTGEAASVFDVRTGEAKGEFTGHAAPVTAGGAAPGSRLVATGDSSGVVIVWDASTRREVARFEGRRSAVRVIAWGPTAQHVAAVADDLTLTLLKADNGRRVFDAGLASGDFDLQFSPDGERLTVVQRTREWDGRELASALLVTEHDLVGSRPARKLRWDRRDADREADPYAGARVDARRRRLALMDGDEVVIWAVDTDSEVCRMDGRADALAWRRDGRLLVARGGELAVASGETGRVEKKLKGAAGVTALAASEDGRIVIGAGPDGALLWKAAEGGDAQDLGPGFDIRVGKSLIAIRDRDGRVTVVRTEDGAVSSIQGDAPDPATGLPMLAVSGEDDVVLHCTDGRPSAWDFDATTEVPCGEPRSAPLSGVMIADDATLVIGPGGFSARRRDGSEAFAARALPLRARGRWVAAREGASLVVFDARAGKEAARFPETAAFDFSGDAIAVLADGEAVVHDLARNRETFRAAAGRGTAIALALNGGRVAFDNGAVQCWDVPGRQRLWTSEARGPLDALRFHPGGAMVAALTRAGAFHLLNDDGTLLLSTTQAAPPAGADLLPFDFSADGTRLALAWTDGPRSYRLDKGVRATVFAQAAGAVRFAPSGDRWIVLSPGRCHVYEGDEFVETLAVDDASFLPGGALVCAAPAGVRLWDGRWRSELRGAAGARISVGADGRRIALVDGATARIWEK